MKKTIFLALLAVLLTSCRESLEDRAAREAETYTEQTCPYRMDEFTTLQAVKFDKATHTFTNEYTLRGDADRELSEAEKENIRTALEKSLQNDTKQRVYREAGYSYRYVYYSESAPKTIIFEATFN
ncbi:MAG: membrane lipoprotein lipid attachment site-containing protein [Prevotella sp.]|nr:membrane lipoprotein lipid attachment site-containing protein [Prevotella sp.]